MERYAAFSGDAGVTAFEIQDEAIVLQFRDGRVYLYSYINPGKEHVEQMKLLARAGRGLTTYVNQYIRENYEAQLK